MDVVIGCEKVYKELCKIGVIKKLLQGLPQESPEQGGDDDHVHGIYVQG